MGYAGDRHSVHFTPHLQSFFARLRACCHPNRNLIRFRSIYRCCRAVDSVEAQEVNAYVFSFEVHDLEALLQNLLRQLGPAQ